MSCGAGVELFFEQWQVDHLKTRQTVHILAEKERRGLEVCNRTSLEDAASREDPIGGSTTGAEPKCLVTFSLVGKTFRDARDPAHAQSQASPAHMLETVDTVRRLFLTPSPP